MADNKSLIRIDVAGQAAATSSGDAVLKRIHEVRENPSLPYKHKRALIQAEVTSLMRARKNELEARLKIQEMKLDADVKAVGRAIDVYRHRVIVEIDNEFNKFMGRLGIKVEVDKLKLLKELGERLREFKESLAGSRMDKRFLRAILKEIDRTFERVHEQLAAHAASLAVPKNEDGE